MNLSVHLKRMTHRLGFRGAFLLFLAELDLVTALTLIFPTPRTLQTPIYVFLNLIAPLDIWGCLWGVTGMLCLVYAFRRDDAPGYAAAMFIKVLWAAMFLLSWAFAHVELGLLGMFVWVSFALVVGLISRWPEPNP
jgi:hypothetical protein